ncbi:MAG: pyridoxamine 5'-phosphate oxidase family protein [Chitinophagaceae bacterium]|nr:pyridoxamine 5'-phosphate oxidase family protein [Chitinophagaceae bacterium]MCB9047526.1 pyridoxamine 5'-phosphate oxidase family protein [Chitinophagales bacterium]
MGKVFDIITPELEQWITAQKMFFVSTAPLSGEGHINCSPKGLDSFRITGPNTVVYQDLTGSGVETIAHLQENGRIVIMFCAFEGPPKIVRLHGRGEVITPSHTDYPALDSLFPNRIDVRAYIRITTTRISDSCGYAVPLYDYKAQRDVLDKYAERKGSDGLIEYRAKKNRVSLDGLKGLD